VSTINELQEKRARLVEEANAVLDIATEEKREFLSDEEQRKFDALHSEADQIKANIARRQRQEAAMREMEGSEGRRSEPSEPGELERRGRGRESAILRPGRVSDQDASEAMRSWFLAGTGEQLTAEQRAACQRIGVDPVQKRFTFNLPSVPGSIERRDLTVGTDSSGGYTVPEGFVAQLEESMEWFGGMREAADIMRTDRGNDLPWPTVNDDNAGTRNIGALLGENAAVSEADPVFSVVTFKAYKYSSKMIQVPVELLQDNAVNLEGYLGRALGERIARITNQHFTTGTGTAQPSGVVTGASSAATTAAAATVTYDELLELVHGVDPAYRRSGRAMFMFSDATLKVLRKMKDGEGNPLWQQGLTSAQPDTILGFRYIVNQDVADIGSAAKSILFGDFSKYKIRDVRDVTLLRLDERYADNHQVAFLAFSRHDGRLLDAGTDPIKFLTQAT
jgi:HK97 family phage major capsid protein